MVQWGLETRMETAGTKGENELYKVAGTPA